MNPIPHVNDKLEDVKVLLGDITKDLQDALTLAQFAIPTVEVLVKKVKGRITQVEKLLGSERKNGRDA